MRVLLKLGGTLLDDPSVQRSLARQIAAAHHAGRTFVVVHGGGRQLTRFLESRGIPSRFVNGLRVTTPETIEAVTQVLAGSVNKRLVADLRAEGATAVGISGADGRLTTASQLAGELGQVGRIDSVDTALLDLLTSAGNMPVVACISADDQGCLYNVNADQMAAACAAALQVGHLVFLTDVDGVFDSRKRVIPELSSDGARALIESGTAAGGMRAKLEAALSALTGGVPQVTIAPGAASSVVSRILDGAPTGTRLVPQVSPRLSSQASS